MKTIIIIILIVVLLMTYDDIKFKNIIKKFKYFFNNFKFKK